MPTPDGRRQQAGSSGEGGPRLPPAPSAADGGAALPTPVRCRMKATSGCRRPGKRRGGVSLHERSHRSALPFGTPAGPRQQGYGSHRRRRSWGQSTTLAHAPAFTPATSDRRPGDCSDMVANELRTTPLAWCRVRPVSTSGSVPIAWDSLPTDGAARSPRGLDRRRRADVRPPRHRRPARVSVAGMELSCAFAPRPDLPELVAHAESLGYRRAWVYDSPALFGDCWMALARCADATSTIGLGPAVLVPSLRHPMVNAAAIATLEQLAPGRAAAALGTGFTGRFVLGQQPMTWAATEAYLTQLIGLLRGEVGRDRRRTGADDPPRRVRRRPAGADADPRGGERTEGSGGRRAGRRRRRGVDLRRTGGVGLVLAVRLRHRARRRRAR